MGSPAHAWWSGWTGEIAALLVLFVERARSPSRAGDTWRNVRAELERLKVVDYERGEARVLQTSELQPETAALLRKLRVAPPAKLLSVGPIPPDSQRNKRRRLAPAPKKRAAS